jgi:hypothetical protein
VPKSVSTNSDSHEGFRRLKIVLVVLLELPVALFILVLALAFIQGSALETHSGLFVLLVSALIVAAIIPTCIYASTWPKRITIAALFYPPLIAIKAGTSKEIPSAELGPTLLAVLATGFVGVGILIGLAWGGVWVFKWVTKGFRTG